MDVVRQMFVKQATNRSKKDKAFTSIPAERCEPPRASIGGGSSLRRKRESPITPARVSSTKTRGVQKFRTSENFEIRSNFFRS